MTQWSAGVVTTSTAVPIVNLTGAAMFGTPFIVRHVYGAVVNNTATVTDSAGSHVVTVSGFTHSKPVL